MQPVPLDTTGPVSELFRFTNLLFCRKGETIWQLTDVRDDPDIRLRAISAHQSLIELIRGSPTNTESEGDLQGNKGFDSTEPKARRFPYEAFAFIGCGSRI